DEAPGEDRENENVHAGGSRRDDSRDAGVGDESALENRVVTLRRAHAEHVPGPLDPVAFGVPSEKAVHDLGRLGIARVHSMEAKMGPHRREASERLASTEAITAFGALGAGRR